MKDCLDCQRADCCHSERVKDAGDLKQAIKFFGQGYTAQAFEELELLLLRMNKRILMLTNRTMEEKC